MGIVVMHGAGPGSGKPNVVAQQWHDALVSGLKAAGLTNAEKQDIRLAFYGDLGRGGRPAANARPTDLQLAIAHDVLANGGVDEQPGWDRLADLVARLHEDVGADKTLLTQFLVDVDAYFGNPDVRERALEAAGSACRESSGPTVLLGHDMGGIIAYDLLATEESGSAGRRVPPDVRIAPRDTQHSKAGGMDPPANPLPDRPSPLDRHRNGARLRHRRGQACKALSGPGRAPRRGHRDPDAGVHRGNAHDPQTYLASAIFAEAVLDLLFPKADLEPEFELPEDQAHAGEPVRRIDIGSAPTLAQAPAPEDDVPIAGSRVVERTASADFPPVVAPGSTHELLVAVAGLAVHARAEALRPFNVPVDQHEVTLKVGVYAADFDRQRR